MAPLTMRAPGNFAEKPKEYIPPTHNWLKGTWTVTHSTLPLWKDKRNVNITYELLPTNSDGVVTINDVVRYQALDSDKVKSTHGIDTPTHGSPGAFDWQGKGLLKVTSSHWECLGWGTLEDDHQWMVTYFAKTLFTPAGLDIYSRKKEGLPQATIEAIRTTLNSIDSKDVSDLTNTFFEIPRD